MEFINEILTDIKDGKDSSCSLHLGSNIYVEVNTEFDGVNIRHWHWCEDSECLKPTRKGVYLTPVQWDKLTLCCMYLEYAIPELEFTKLCYERHHNKVDVLTCAFCTPNSASM